MTRDRTPYVPSRKQIRRACEKIQREWDEAERDRRRGGPSLSPVEVKTVKDPRFSSILMER